MKTLMMKKRVNTDMATPLLSVNTYHQGHIHV